MRHVPRAAGRLDALATRVAHAWSDRKNRSGFQQSVTGSILCVNADRMPFSMPLRPMGRPARTKVPSSMQRKGIRAAPE